ncbi:MAG: helix-turn-helix transcriptional regulator [Paenibacillaceae bacterium]|nr:helix-turn-helix transcriptional regulator [Paenibacillaceae bacterium]
MSGSKELGQLLRELRGKQSLRQASAKTGISHTYLGIIEKGADARSGNPVKPTPETLKSLSDAYGYPYASLLEAAGYLREPGAGYEAGTTPPAERENLALEQLPARTNVTFRGRQLTAADKRKIVDMLDVMFGS